MSANNKGFNRCKECKYLVNIGESKKLAPLIAKMCILSDQVIVNAYLLSVLGVICCTDAMELKAHWQA